jgi:hypothetical protein
MRLPYFAVVNSRFRLTEAPFHVHVGMALSRLARLLLSWAAMSGVPASRRDRRTQVFPLRQTAQDHAIARERALL